MLFEPARVGAATALLGLLLAPYQAGGHAAIWSARPFFVPREESLTEDDVRTIDRGRAVARVVETRDRSEVMAIGVLRVRSSADQALDRLRDVEGRRGDGDVLAIQEIGSPPTLRDFSDLSLPAGDLNCLRNCRVGDCDVRMSGEWIRRFRREIDWSSPQHRQAAGDLFREMLSGYAKSYMAHGNSALPVYEDAREPVRAAENLDELLRRFEGPLDTVPELRRYLTEFPRGRPEGAEDFLYWVKERLWAHVVVSINHVTLLRRTIGSHRVVLAASKQIYASHYFDSALRTTAFVEEPGGGDPWLVFVSRTRTDTRPGFTWLQRILIRRLVCVRLQKQMAVLRDGLESRARLFPAEP